MLTDPMDAEIVRSIHNISRVMGIRTIAEYVENDVILQRLHELGVDMAQGYAIHHPAPLQQ